jgi:hypothetical protein
VSKAERRPLRLLGVAVMVGGGSLALAACSSGGSSSASSSGGADAAEEVPTSLCQQIGGVLSDGPDSDADPVGAALSQILPLQGIHSSDTSVIYTVSNLASADQAFYHSNGTDKTASTAIEKAEAALNKACPGVAS